MSYAAGGLSSAECGRQAYQMLAARKQTQHVLSVTRDILKTAIER